MHAGINSILTGSKKRAAPTDLEASAVGQRGGRYRAQKEYYVRRKCATSPLVLAGRFAGVNSMFTGTKKRAAPTDAEASAVGSR